MKNYKRKRYFITGLLTLTRFPNLVIIALAQYLTAIFLTGHFPVWYKALVDIKLFLLSLSTVMIAAAGYIINDYYDIKIDYINRPEKVVVGRVFKRRIVLTGHFVLTTLGVAIGFYLGIYIGAIHLFSAFSLWWYSNQLKRMPFIGNFMISILTGLSIFVMAIFYRHNGFLIGCYTIFAVSVTIIREIIKDMEDVRGDERFGSKTLPIVWGMARTKYFLYFLVAISCLVQLWLAILIGNQILNAFFAVLTIPILYFLYLLRQADTTLHFRRLSLYCKLFMLLGIISMTFFNY